MAEKRYDIPTTLLKKIKAEFLLNILYTDDVAKWQVECKGDFYRDYSPDIMYMDEEQRYVALSRNSFLHLLPNELLSPPSELQGGNALEIYGKIKKRIRLLSDAFLPFDTMHFEKLLAIEEGATQILTHGRRDIVNEYFGIDIEEEDSTYVKKLLPLLPYVSTMRGDFPLIGKMLETLVGYPTSIVSGRYDVGEDKNEAWPLVEYNINVDGLNAEQYKELDSLLEPLRQFLMEWLVPYDTIFKLRIRNSNKEVNINGNTMLDYNTSL